MPSAPTSRLARRFRLAVGAAPALLAFTACTGPGAPVRQSLTVAPNVGDIRGSYLLGAAELRQAETRTVLDVVGNRWPAMVRGDLPRGGSMRLTGPDTPIFQDRFGVYDSRGTFLGGPEYIASLHTEDILELRRLTEMEERIKFGRSHPAGAVILTWRSLRP
jgi:hypothetical protein